VNEELKKQPITIRRKHNREPYFSVIDYVVQEDSYTDFTQNISAGGVFISTGTQFSVGQEVSMVFPLPVSKENIRIKGEIVRVSELGIGVQFKMANPRQEAIIESLIKLM
jgi:Tfp pilus assembly protein PilZ